MGDVKVRYKGMSDVRILPADQLKERGVKGIDEDLVFGPNNMWAQTVPMSDELEAILRQDGAFSIEPVNDDGSTGKEEVTATGADDTGNTVVMPDGQVDTKEEGATTEAGSVDTEPSQENVPLSSGTTAPTTPDTNVAGS